MALQNLSGNADQINTVIDVAVYMIESFAAMVTFANDTGLIPFIMGLGGLKLAFTAIPGLGTVVAAIFAKIGGVLGTVAGTAPAAGGGLASAITAIGAAGAASAIGILAVGGAFLLMGAGIGLAAYGLSFVVAEFAKMDPMQILAAGAAIFLMTYAFSALALAMGAVAIAAMGLANPVVMAGMAMMIGIAGVALAIGKAIQLAAEGFVHIFETGPQVTITADVLSTMGDGLKKFEEQLTPKVEVALTNLALLTSGRAATADTLFGGAKVTKLENKQEFTLNLKIGMKEFKDLVFEIGDG
jgi:hypothetical protein